MSAIAQQQKNKAQGLISEAEKSLSSRSWFGGKERRMEDAAELFDQAGNAFKVGGFYHEAGDAYKRAADIYLNLASTFEASKALQNAATNYKKVNPEMAIEAYNQAIFMMTDAGRVMQAAKLSKEVAELYISEDISMEEKSSTVLAIETYEQAADLFMAEDSNAQASQCKAKIAELCSVALDPPELMRAAEIYGELGTRCLESNLLKFNAKGYFLQALLCKLALGDSVSASKTKKKYSALDYTFPTSRDGKFVDQLIACMNEYDTEAFATTCYEYDRVQRLDPWKTAILTRIKKSIDEAAGVGEAEDDDDIDLT